MHVLSSQILMYVEWVSNLVSMQQKRNIATLIIHIRNYFTELTALLTQITFDSPCRILTFFIKMILKD